SYVVPSKDEPIGDSDRRERRQCVEAVPCELARQCDERGGELRSAEGGREDLSIGESRRSLVAAQNRADRISYCYGRHGGLLVQDLGFPCELAATGSGLHGVVAAVLTARSHQHRISR